ncbi:MAG: mitochondrial fission ELM1 family protein [Pseudomonadota bacterium]
MRVLTDGRAGNENPAKALASAVAAAWPAGADAVEIVIERLALRPGAALAPPALWARFGPRAAFAALSDSAAVAAAPRADLLIGAGRRSAPIVAALRATTGACAVQILWPQMPIAGFDFVIAPRHDRIPAAAAGHPALIRTIGALTDLSPEALSAERARPDPRLDALPKPVIGVLVGGRSGSARFAASDADALSEAIERFSAEGASIAATGSRRTPEEVAARLSALIRGRGGFWWDGAGENPFRAILARADALIVTADSVNMASEAASAGPAVLIAPVGRLSPKLARFHAALEAGGHARPLSEATALADLVGASPAPLAETPAIAERLVARLLADRAGR